MSGAKAKHYKRHAARRANERHDLLLSTSDMNALAKQIRRVFKNPDSAEGRVLERQSETRSLVLVNWQGTLMRVVYARSTGSIVTVLPAVDGDQHPPPAPPPPFPGLGSRLAIALEAAGIDTVAKLEALDARDLLDVPGIETRGQVDTIQAWLAQQRRT